MQSAIRFDNKLLSGKWAEGLNPFGYNINDTSLLITNSTLRNTLFLIEVHRYLLPILTMIISVIKVCLPMALKVEI